MNSKILITGAAGFIGFHLSKLLLDKSYQVIGLDNLNDYYDEKLKEDRLEILQQNNNFTFHKVDLKDKPSIDDILATHKIENPYAYVDSNLIGFMNILEACRNYPVKHLLYASSSSVYGSNKVWAAPQPLD